MAPPFDVARFEAKRDARALALGKPFSYVALTGSTNDDALAAARAGIGHGATFVADAQSSGRGRRGRHWFAAPGESLLCSVVVRAELSVERASLLALLAGVSVRAAIANAAAESGAVDRAERVRVKWPNDVWIDDRKVAGVLCESHVQGARLDAAVIGFGVNVSGLEFPSELKGSATSLLLASVQTSREDLLVEILAGLEARVQSLLDAGAASLVHELTTHDALRGRRVRVEALEGVAAGFDHSGRLLLEVSQDEMVSLSAGTVELVA